MIDLRLAFADSLKTRRASKHWSRKELAAASGVSVHAISKYEQRASSPSLETIAKLSEALGCTPSDLCKFPKVR